MSKRFLSPLRLVNLTSDPSGGSEGDIYFNTVGKVLKVYNGTDWVSLIDNGAANTQAKYLLEHNHGEDGLVNEVYPAGTIYPDPLLQENMNTSLTPTVPVLVFDGGTPTDFPSSPSYEEFTLLDGGGVS